MLHHIIKIIRAERRANLWIWLEMLAVCGLLWFVTDYALTALRAWSRPLNYDIEHVYRLMVGTVRADSEGGQKDMSEDKGKTMMQTLDLVAAYPGVEAASIQQWGGHYSSSSSMNSLKLDTVTLSSVEIRMVSPDYFRVFRVYGADGSSPEKMAEQFSKLRMNDIQRDYYLSRNALDHVEQANGEGRESDRRYLGMSDSISYSMLYFLDDVQVEKKIRYNQTFKGVLPNQPRSEAEKSEYICLMPITEEYIGQNEHVSYSIYLRISPEADTPDFKEKFMKRMKAVTQDGTFPIMSIGAVSEDRAIVLADPIRQINNHLAIGFFLLLNIFLGIVGTFWVRTEQRRAEVGIRRVVGSTNKSVLSLMFGEGLVLMTLAFLPAAIAAWYVMFHTDLCDITVFPVGWGRLLIGLICTYLQMLLMVLLGTSIPVTRALRVPPTEAIRSE
ncbi:ABC transporter permease [Porphyromonas loveana]|uniref:Putative ABC transport system permease protein n=1 Tax=Porphyromonas loveana TaxID=1884669 RepID=A0A2U1FCE4_9PORP|nr:FtsX-like permease family protein [Porphyromonas loveana]PVZ09871.1 putative ABC transport system permease protein [Porphyromonas loveana]